MTTDLRFGFPDKDIIHVRESIEALFKIVMNERNSGFYGGKYFRYKSIDFGELILQNNFDQLEDEWIEEDHKDLFVILSISGQLDMEEARRVLDKIQGCVHISQKIR